MTLTTLSYNTNKYFSPGWPHQQLQPQQEQEQQQLSMNNKKLLYHQMKNLHAPKNELASDSAHATVTAANKLLHQHHASHHHHQQQQHNSTVPFWLGHEEETQIEFILKQYAKHFRLDIYEQSSMPSRSSCSSLSSSGSGSGCAMRPKEFIGKVVRQLSKNFGELSEGELITMDTVFLFFRDKGRSPDHLMAFARRYNLKTVWNKSDGTPVRFETVTAPSNRNSDSDENDAHCSSPYILYCLPVFGSKIDNDFRYYTADGVSGCEDICDNKVTYSDLMSQAVFKQRDTIRMVKSFSNPDFSLSEDGTQPEKTWNCDEYDEDGYDDENEEYEDYDDVDDEYDDDEDDLYRDFNYEVHSRLEQDTHNDYCYSISGRSCHSVGVLDKEPDELSGQPQGHSRPSYMDLLVVSSSSCPYSIYQFDFVQSADAAVMDQSNSDTEDQDDSDEESEEEEDDDDESEEDSDSDEEDWEEESDDDDE